MPRNSPPPSHLKTRAAPFSPKRALPSASNALYSANSSEDSLVPRRAKWHVREYRSVHNLYEEQYSPQGKRLYCLLLKATYGLKQGSRQWYLKLSEVMKDLGFKKVRSEPCVYIFLRGDDRVIVPSYVDDLHIASKSKEAIQRVKDEDVVQSAMYLNTRLTANQCTGPGLALKRAN